MTVEPLTGNDTGLLWIRSTYSSNDGPECVEVAAAGGVVHVRDSKDKCGPRFAVGTEAWTAFLAHTAR
ncbi:DUF397 domain-containing protein [Streptomyces sp. ACA25]|uniref:DUF397 domain-containing protein n=1 Tax=Streptomyces sp. ACA25 TaxID=3022596 RepID=UPI0023079CB6|nr:DUF397 domain-containing protein [Streptomyces sp. ACA25]MDB1088374.1 DUF397 domain-containing protein [Streptomyces sp. ACA25]